jgi:hypothetical protein
MKHPLHPWIVATLLALALLLAGHAQADNLYRWVDESGKVHFTTTLPPEAADRPYHIYSASGILLERVSDPRELVREQAEEERLRASGKKVQPLYSEEEKQLIADRLLLLKYRSEEEIAEALQLEIDHTKYDERILTGTAQSLLNSLAGQVNVAANRQRAGLEIEEAQQNDIAVLRKRLQANQISMQQLNERKQKIQAEFDAELEHYRRLVAAEAGQAEG